jgi:hypothetical protein
MEYASTSKAEPTPDEDAAGLRLFRRMAFGSLALLFVAGALLWWRFGSTIFFDVLAALQGCF